MDSDDEDFYEEGDFNFAEQAQSGMLNEQGLGDLLRLDIVKDNDASLRGLASSDATVESSTLRRMLSSPGMTAYEYGVLMYFIFLVMRSATAGNYIDSTLSEKRSNLMEQVDQTKEEFKRLENVCKEIVNALRGLSTQLPIAAIKVQKGEMTSRLRFERNRLVLVKQKLTIQQRQLDAMLVDIITAPQPSMLLTGEDRNVDSWCKFAEGEYLQTGMSADLPVGDDLQPRYDPKFIDKEVMFLKNRMLGIALTPSQLLQVFSDTPIAMPGYNLQANQLIDIYYTEGGIPRPTIEATLLSSISRVDLQGEFVNLANLDIAIVGRAQYQLTPLMLEVSRMNDLIKLGVNPVVWTRTTGTALSGFALKLYETWNKRGRKKLTTDVLMQTFKAANLGTTYSIPREVVTRSLMESFMNKKNKGAKKEDGNARGAGDKDANDEVSTDS